MYYHRPSKTIYLAHPRTASKATREALYERGFEVAVDHHGGLEQGRQHLRVAVTTDWAVWATVRNHFDALVSWQGVQEPGTFDCEFGREYIEHLIDNNHQYFPDPHRMWGLHLDDATRVLHYESLENDLNDALEDRGLEPVDLPEVGGYEGRERGDTAEWYDAETRAFVAGLFRQEMKALGYTWR